MADMNCISDYAHAYARALDFLQDIRNYRRHVKEKKLSIIQMDLSDVAPGYGSEVKEITEILNKELDELLAKAEANANSAVRKAHGDLDHAARLGNNSKMEAGKVQ